MKYIAIDKFILICILLSIISCSNQKKKEKIGDNYIIKIEKHKELTGGYPSSLSEIGIDNKEEGPLYYYKRNDSLFIVWFEVGFGDSRVYSSNTKRWGNASELIIEE